jgi:glutamate-1-semialdehyde 2,1-aminomutase
MKKIVAVVQARMGSTRMPGKVLELINGVSVIELLLRRLNLSVKIDKIVVAIPVGDANDSLRVVIQNAGFTCEVGDEKNVLARVYHASKKHGADTVVRITGDCPFVDPVLVDEVINFHQANIFDYTSNVEPPTFPDGMDVEVFSFAVLEKVFFGKTSEHDEEHVTPKIRESANYSTINFANLEDLSHLRWTLDEPKDLVLIRSVFGYFEPEIHFGWPEILTLYQAKPEIFQVNNNIIRNEGADMATGQKLYKRAKRVILGGNSLLSKRPEMFLPEKWPSYFSKSAGCKVWDLDGNEYTDMSIMGVGTNILGYGDPEVDDAVREVISSGNMSTLNCPEEVFLAEKLLSMNPWAGKVKFARSGGEANAMAIRIARTACGKDNVAVCGYHGWHDWYLSANLDSNSNLDKHLLSGLSPAGVPRNLEGTVFPFNYNNFDELENLVRTKGIGIIKMEVVRNKGPEDNFLHKVRKLATDNQIILIFDECTSGFRETFGGIHTKYHVEPDMVMFGKALGNGYAITAIVGREDIMEEGERSFISSTFWTERIGPAAALKALEVMEKTRSWEVITHAGESVRNGIEALAVKHDLDINSWGLSALTGYTFNSQYALQYKTFITQEMLKEGYLAGNCVYLCTKHTPEIIKNYLDTLDPIFESIKEFEEGKDIAKMLDGPVCHAGFQRLN